MMNPVLRLIAFVLCLAAAPLAAQVGGEDVPIAQGDGDDVPVAQNDGEDVPTAQGDGEDVQVAQDDGDDVPAAQTEAAEPAADLPKVFNDIEEWDSFTARVETAIEGRLASNNTLSTLRSQLTNWRDTFIARQSTNRARILTVKAQQTALGEKPETVEEDPRIAARRAALDAQLKRLRAPVVLAEEAYAQANGLIGEIDSLLRERQAQRFAERVQSPLNPAGWSRAWTSVNGALKSAKAEVISAMSNPSRRSEFTDVLPAILVLLAIAVVFVLRGRAWYSRATEFVVARSKRSREVVQFVLSLGQIVIPFVGFLALSSALDLSGMTGRRIGAVVSMLPELSLFPIVAHWIAGHLLPNGVEQDHHPLFMTPEVSSRAHRRFIFLGYMLFLYAIASTFVRAHGFDDVPAGIVMFPFSALVAWVLYWFGHLLRNGRVELSEDSKRSFRVTLRAILSHGLKLAAVLGLLFAALGYSNALEVITIPAAVTVYVIATLLLLQKLSVDVYSMVSKSDNGAQDALIPVLIGFLLILIALPILAIIWGAQVTDITELWARFREGFAIGETRISPSSFLLFALVFVIGYTVTRLVQAALRTTVLPRTKLDAGGQNAVVSGMGYLGIFLAAVIAISMAGIDLSGLAIVAGALSVGIGFGLQNIVSNFISGIILLIERPISQGDWIEVGGQMGYVRDISVRSTRIETFDRTDVIVPNADLISNQVINWTRGNNVGRVIIDVGIAYGTDTKQAEKILLEIALQQPMVLVNPGPSVIFTGIGASTYDFQIRAILRDINWMMIVKSDINHEIVKRFAEADIEMAFPQQDIWLRNPETLNFADKPQPKAASDTKAAADTPDLPSDPESQT